MLLTSGKEFLKIKEETGKSYKNFEKVLEVFYKSFWISLYIL